MSINPFSFDLPESVSETSSFIDPLHPDAPIELTFSVNADYTITLDVAVKGQELAETYVTGRRGGPPAPAITNKGKQITGVTAQLCRTVAQLMAYDASPEPYTFEQWCWLAKAFPTAFSNICAWGIALDARAHKDLSPGE